MVGVLVKRMGLKALERAKVKNKEVMGTED
jgi:hypothetical protein